MFVGDGCLVDELGELNHLSDRDIVGFVKIIVEDDVGGEFFAAVCSLGEVVDIVAYRKLVERFCSYDEHFSFGKLLILCGRLFEI